MPDGGLSQDLHNEGMHASTCLFSPIQACTALEIISCQIISAGPALVRANDAQGMRQHDLGPVRTAMGLGTLLMRSGQGVV